MNLPCVFKVHCKLFLPSFTNCNLTFSCQQIILSNSTQLGRDFHTLSSQSTFLLPFIWRASPPLKSMPFHSSEFSTSKTFFCLVHYCLAHLLQLNKVISLLTAWHCTFSFSNPLSPRDFQPYFGPHCGLKLLLFKNLKP